MRGVRKDGTSDSAYDYHSIGVFVPYVRRLADRLYGTWYLRVCFIPGDGIISL